MSALTEPAVATTITEMRELVIRARRNGMTVGVVPTMGALHEGHLSLVRRARQRCAYVVVTVFVNPIQFNNADDLRSYPRTLDADVDACGAEGVDAVFAPHVDEMYGPRALTRVRVEKLTEPLCGRDRPGHFEGVTTVVAKLFNIVQPDVAFFGQKDAQQAIVVRRMTEDLNFPVEVDVCPTVREPDGLAMSSRNARLTPEQRRQATCLYRALEQARSEVAAGQVRTAPLIASMREVILSAGPCEIDYVEIVDAKTLEPIEEVTDTALMALAVQIGPARLIDNVQVDPSGPAL